MLTVKQRLARIFGAYLHGFLVVGAATTPFDPDFQVIIIKAAWGGLIACLFQCKKLVDEHGKASRKKS